MVTPAASRPRFLAPGDKLGRYDLIRQIAVGGMAELYLARTVGIEGFEKLVVVKRILPQFATNASFVNMFLNEARLAATLHHPNIVQVYDIGQEGSEYFFAMEYIHGEDLGRLTASATDSGVPISLDVALTLVAGLCAGLNYAHDKAGPDGKPLNTVHRDVSPSNVLVSYDGAVKLVDFGIARAGSQPSTTRGGIKGKIGYMSPEQCRGKEVLDRRSDIFSVGAILYELTTGRQPFTDETEYGVLSQIVNTDAQPPSRLVQSYPPALEKIVMRALARDREQRYPSALELQGAIEDFAHDNRLRVSPLVLARLMGTLFPTRLEEWDSARAQGAFFVEQHVVRTLIESGKSTESGVQLNPFNDDDTSVSAPPVPGDNEPTNVQANIADMQRGVAALPPTEPLPIARPTPRAQTPASMSPAVRQPTPIPVTPPAPIRATPPVALPGMAAPLPRTPMPGAVPIVNAGTLVSSAGSYGTPVAAVPVAAVSPMSIGDVTERVRVPSAVSIAPETSMLQVGKRSKVPYIVVGAAGLAGVVIAMVIIFSGGNAPETKAASTPSAAKAAEPSPSPEPPKEEPAVVKEEPKVKEEPTIAKEEPKPEVKEEPKVETPKAEPKVEAKVETPKETPKAEPKVAKKPPKVEHAKVVKTEKKQPEVKKEPPKTEPKVEPKVEPKPEPKPEPKETKWNADSPFMPVRPGDKK